MKTKINSLPPKFLKKYREGKTDEVVYCRLSLGFLKLEYGLYDNPGTLSRVSFVLDDLDEATAIGSRLELVIGTDYREDEATFISENGVSGLQWSGGEVIWGHTYDDDTPTAPGRKISLDSWVDECVKKMINPDPRELEERRALDLADKEYQTLLKKHIKKAGRARH